MQRRTPFVATAAVLVLAAISLDAQEPRHPLDPLGWEEYWAVLEVLRDAGHLTDGAKLPFVTLVEPEKGLVWRWADGQPFTRTALAVVREGAATHEAVIDLRGRRVSSWTEKPGVHAQWTEDEFVSVVGEVKKHPDFIAALAKRGITDLTFIDCFAVPPGYFGTDEQQGRRVSSVFCSDPRGVRNTYTRAIEGVTVVVDMVERKVIRVVDEGVVPMPAVRAEYDRASLGPPREVPGPIQVTQPMGPGFTLDGHRVTWQNWSFHVRPDTRLGVIVSTVRYRDGDRDRPVLYQGSLSEIFVPYMDPAFAWYTRNFIDAGEFSAGGLTKPLRPGVDCPEHALFMDYVLAGGDGRPQSRSDMICIFERAAGDVSWRHYAGGEVHGRARRDLVIRTAAVLGNYDYLFDWVFMQDGTIQVGVGSTGIAEVKMVREAGAVVAVGNGNGASGNGGNGADGAGAADAAPDAYGRFVAPNVVAVNHDHYFSFRLDLDVDGAANNFVVDRLRTVTLPEDHPRRSIWVAEQTVATTESQGKLNIDYDRPAFWRVTSPTATNHVGYPTSYQIRPMGNTNTLLTADDYPRRRAGFIDHHLWVTPHAPGELYAAGDYPTLSLPGQGLPGWTANDRSIAGRDVVVWYTVGMHHMVRAEDWPVMPVMWHTFELRPFDFFDENPAMDLPLRP